MASGLTSHITMVIPLTVGLHPALAAEQPALAAGARKSRLAAVTTNQVRVRRRQRGDARRKHCSIARPVTIGILIEHVNAVTATAACALAVGILGITATLSEECATEARRPTPLRDNSLYVGRFVDEVGLVGEDEGHA